MLQGLLRLDGAAGLSDHAARIAARVAARIAAGIAAHIAVFTLELPSGDRACREQSYNA